MNYQLLTKDVHYTKGTKYPFVTLVDLNAKLFYTDKHLVFKSKGKPLAVLKNNQLTIFDDYACDGYTPVIRLFGKFIKLVPIPKCGLYPAILHDIMLQFVRVENCPWKRKDAHNEFHKSLIAGRETFVAWLYFNVVNSWAGSLYSAIFKSDISHLEIEIID